MTGRGLVLGLARATGLKALFSGEGHAPAPPSALEGGQAPDGAAALDMPDWLLPELQRSLGDRLPLVAEAMRHRAPVFLRVNLRKTDRAGAIAALAAEGVVAEAHPLAQTALEVTGNARKVQTSSAYAQGLVELQDAASQAVVEMLPLSDGMTVLDQCAGGGGKSLAMAARADLRLFAHDIEPRRMADLPERAGRAGVAVTRTDQPAAKAPYDGILVDAPCSGSGSWRRDPEGKWSLTPERLAALCATQAAILAQVAPWVRPGGWLGYATCSLLEVENGDQTARFLETHPGWTCLTTRRFTPLEGGDGFFLALLQRV